MKQILVATDFSTRSDRALRRATLLARQSSAALLLVHVVDDDQPQRLLEAGRQAATGLLDELAGTLRDSDGLACEAHVLVGDAFEAIGKAAGDLEVDLLVMGPHRRQALRDIFIGTTVERTIRHSRRPVLMANAVPAGPYRRVLLATDFSECSLLAAATAQQLGLLDAGSIAVLHSFEAPAQGLMLRASTTSEQLQHYLAEEERRAGAELADFLGKVEVGSATRVVQLAESSPAQTILRCARSQDADLVVLGTRGRSGLGKLILGSVTEEVLRDAQVDVLAVPPAETRPASPS